MTSLASIALAVSSLLLTTVGTAASQELDSLWKGKTKTDRTIVLEVTVEAPPAEVFVLWTTAEGVRKFMAPDADIEPRLGGDYTIIFEPDRDPDGTHHGTKGARILRFVPYRELAFEWPMPPWGDDLGAIPNPTWVELRFEPVAGEPDKTHLRLAHYGFRHGKDWDEAFRSFGEGNWPMVLNSLVAYCRDGSAPWYSRNRSQSGENSEETLKAEVRAELQSYYADFSARDWEAFADHFWPGATLTTIWQPPGEDQLRVVATSVPDFVAQAPQGPGSKPIFEEKMTGAEVRVVRDLAQVWARYRVRFGEPGNVQEWSGIDALTLMKHDGRWKMISLAFTTEH